LHDGTGLLWFAAYVAWACVHFCCGVFASLTGYGERPAVPPGHTCQHACSCYGCCVC
jgi:hypothetical protein